MKRKFFIMLQVTIILALIAVMLGSVPAGADPPDPNKVYKTRFLMSGKTAFLNYNTETECQEIFVYLEISENMYKQMPDMPWPPPAGPMGYIGIEIWNWCHDEEQWGYAQIEFDPNDPNSGFIVSENLRSASAVGKGTLEWEWEDENNEEPITEEVTINIEWKGESAVSSGHNNLRARFTAWNSDFRMHMNSSGTSRYASAKGLIKGETFEIEADVPFYPPYPYMYPGSYPYPAPYPYYYGGPTSIGKSMNGSITIEKRLKSK